MTRDRLLEWAKQHAGDLAIAVIAIGTFIELAATTAPYKPVLIPLTLFMAPALFFRRQFPLVAPSTTLAAIGIAVAIDPSGVKNVGFFFFSALAATVTFGATVERRIAFAGGAISLALLTWVNYKFGNKPSDYAYMMSFFAAAWFVGFILRTRTHQASEARERAERNAHTHAATGTRATCLTQVRHALGKRVGETHAPEFGQSWALIRAESLE